MHNCNYKFNFTICIKIFKQIRDNMCCCCYYQQQHQYRIYSADDFEDFRPRGATHFTDYSDIWHSVWDRNPPCCAKFYVVRSTYGNFHPPKNTKNREICKHCCPTGATFLIDFRDNYVVYAGGCENGTNILYLHAKRHSLVAIRHHTAAGDGKVPSFFVSLCHFVTLGHEPERRTELHLI